MGDFEFWIFDRLTFLLRLEFSFRVISMVIWTYELLLLICDDLGIVVLLSSKLYKAILTFCFIKRDGGSAIIPIIKLCSNNKTSRLCLNKLHISITTSFISFG